MNLSVFQCYLTLSLTVFLGLYTRTNAEKKGKGTVKLCGNEFLEYYKLLCGSSSRGRRSLLKLAKKEIPKIKNDKLKATFPMMKEKLAKQFLRRIRRITRGLGDNATEECCNETCTLEEVKEYPCSNVSS